MPMKPFNIRKSEKIRKKALYSAFFLIVFVILGTTAVSASPSDNNLIKKIIRPQHKELNIYLEPHSVPKIKFKHSRGNDVSIDDFKGKVLILNFWSTSCGLCVAELPDLDKLQKSFGHAKFEVISLSTGADSLPNLRQYFLKKRLKNIDVYLDKNKALSKSVGVFGLPTALLINSKGQEIGRVKGFVDWNSFKMKSIISELIKEARIESEEKDKNNKANSKMPFNRWALPMLNVLPAGGELHSEPSVSILMNQSLKQSNIVSQTLVKNKKALY